MKSDALKTQLDFLEWDTRFFGRPVFRSKTSGYTPSLMDQLFEGFGNTSDAELIYLQDSKTHHFSVKMPRHWEIVDVGAKVSLDLTLKPSESLPPTNEDVLFSSWRAKETSESLRVIYLVSELITE